MISMFTQTEREKQGTVDGINLFFGALLGTNLGMLDGLALMDYATIIIVLAATVMTLRIFSTSERRGYAYFLLGSYILFVAYLLFSESRPEGLSQGSAHRLAVTLAVWLASVLIVEFYPTTPSAKPEGGSSG